MAKVFAGLMSANPPAIPPALERAYRATAYRARLPEGPITLRVGEPIPARFTRHLRARGARHWAFITAWNPGSRPAGAAENRAAGARLERELQRRGWEHFPARGVPDAPADWSPEPAHLVIGIAPEAARALGRAYGQLAVLLGEAEAPARLEPCAE